MVVTKTVVATIVAILCASSGKAWIVDQENCVTDLQLLEFTISANPTPVPCTRIGFTFAIGAWGHQFLMDHPLPSEDPAATLRELEIFDNNYYSLSRAHFFFGRNMDSMSEETSFGYLLAAVGFGDEIPDSRRPFYRAMLARKYFDLSGVQEVFLIDGWQSILGQLGVETGLRDIDEAECFVLSDIPSADQRQILMSPFFDSCVEALQ